MDLSPLFFSVLVCFDGMYFDVWSYPNHCFLQTGHAHMSMLYCLDCFISRLVMFLYGQVLHRALFRDGTEGGG